MRLSADPAARRRLAVLSSAAVAALIVGAAVGAGRDGNDAAEPPTGSTPPDIGGGQALEAVDRLTLSQQVGQLTISSFPEPAAPD